MKCAECSDRWKCGAGYDLRRKRRGCEKAKKPAKRSNADRIRSMTDAELANLLVDVTSCNSHCPARSDWCRDSDSACRYGWIEWLKQECDDNGT